MRSKKHLGATFVLIFPTRTNWPGLTGCASELGNPNRSFEVRAMTSTPAASRVVKAGEVHIRAGSALLHGELKVPEYATGIVLFAHGSGSSRHSPRNHYVAGVIRDAGVGTLLFDLLTRREEEIDNYTREFRFDINLLAWRLIGATEWLAAEEGTKHLRPGYFGASTGGAAALVAAAEMGRKVGAVV